jgi:hypothetical protein
LFIIGPVEREDGEIEQLEESFFEQLRFVRWIAPHQVKSQVTEEEILGLLDDLDFYPFHRFARGGFELQACLALPVALSIVAGYLEELSPFGYFEIISGSPGDRG